MFYALDLGGTNFRVLRVQLLGGGGGIGKMEYEGASISPELMTGTTEVCIVGDCQAQPLVRKAGRMGTSPTIPTNYSPLLNLTDPHAFAECDVHSIVH